MKRLLLSAIPALATLLLCSCGGGAVDAPAAPAAAPSSGSATIQGVQTPTQISVVSAK